MSHGSAASDQAHAHFPLGENRFFPARETHVAGKRNFASVSCRPPPDQGDRHDGRMRQAHENVRPSFETRRALRDVGEILELGVEVAVVQEEHFDGAVEDHDPELLVGLEGRDDLRISGTNSGPIKLSGGLSNVTRQ